MGSGSELNRNPEPKLIRRNNMFILEYLSWTEYEAENFGLTNCLGHPSPEPKKMQKILEPDAEPKKMKKVLEPEIDAEPKNHKKKLG